VNFTEILTAKGVPNAVCDLSFKKYVDGTSSSSSSSVKKAHAVDDVVNEVFSEFLNESMRLDLKLDTFRSFSE